MPDNIVDSLRVKIEGDSRAASNTIDALVADLGKLKTALDGIKTSKVGSLFTPTSAKNANAFADAIDRIDIAKLRELSTIKITNPFAGGNLYGAVTEGFQSTITLLERISTRLGKFSSRQRDVAATTKKATSAIHAQAKAAHSTHKSFSLANTALGKFFNSVKRIAFYRMIRSASKAVTQGFSEGIQNLYFWSQAVGTSFAPAMDRLATATLYLKNGFASMWSPLIEYAIPIIDMAIDKLVDFFNLIQEGFARLVGAPTWNKALKYPVQFAKNTDGAAKSAKKLQNILMGFDEMNVINTPNDSGRGSGADAKDYSSMFQLMQTKTSGEFAKWGERLRKLASTFAPAFEPLKRVLKSTRDLIKNVVKATGEWIDETDFQPLADSIKEVNTAFADLVDVLNGGLFTAYTEVLLPLATWFTEKGAPEGLKTFAKAIIIVKNALHLLNLVFLSFWNNTKELREKIGQFFLNRNEEIKNLFTVVGEWIEKSTPTFERLGGVIGKIANTIGSLLIPIFELIAKVGWQPFIQGITLVLSTLTPVLEILATVLDLINTILSPILEKGGKGIEIITKVLSFDIAGVIADIKAEAEDFSSGDFFKRWGKDFEDFANGVVSGWTDIKNGAQSALEEYLLPKLEEWYGKLKNNEGFNTFLDNAMKWFANFKTWWDMNVAQKVLKFAKVDWPNIKQKVKEKWDTFVSWWNTKFMEIKLKVPDLVAKMRTAWENLRSWWSRLSLDAFHIKLPHFGLDYSSGGILPRVSVQWYAKGGFPELGEPFFMGEGGVPEMLGKVNGRSAVVGGAEITGISDTIRAQGAREERLLETLIGVLERKDFSFTPNAAAGRAINQALRQYAGVTG